MDEEICAGWDEFGRQRALTDDAIDAFVASLSDEKLDSKLHFVSLSNPTPRELPFWIAVQHLFNHQTHHRGQIMALMEQAGLDCGVTDFAMMPGFRRQIFPPDDENAAKIIFDSREHFKKCEVYRRLCAEPTQRSLADCLPWQAPPRGAGSCAQARLPAPIKREPSNPPLFWAARFKSKSAKTS